MRSFMHMKFTRLHSSLVVGLILHALWAHASDLPGGGDALGAYTRGDYKTAMKLLKPMAEQGNSFAQFTIGKMYLNGEGIPKDPVKAAANFKLAATQGLAVAQLNLGRLYAEGQGVAKDP